MTRECRDGFAMEREWQSGLHTRSLPARSTKCIFDLRMMSDPTCEERHDKHAHKTPNVVQNPEAQQHLHLENGADPAGGVSVPLQR